MIYLVGRLADGGSGGKTDGKVLFVMFSRQMKASSEKLISHLICLVARRAFSLNFVQTASFILLICRISSHPIMDSEKLSHRWTSSPIIADAAIVNLEGFVNGWAVLIVEFLPSVRNLSPIYGTRDAMIWRTELLFCFQLIRKAIVAFIWERERESSL